MCFDAKRIHGKAKKITSDLTGFKVLKGKKILRSPIRTGFKWNVGEVMEELDFENKADYIGRVHTGFHCFRTLRDLIDGYVLGRSDKIYLVRIPAGSLVHINDTQYCSNQMMVENYEPLKEIKRRGRSSKN